MKVTLSRDLDRMRAEALAAIDAAAEAEAEAGKAAAHAKKRAEAAAFAAGGAAGPFLTAETTATGADITALARTILEKAAADDARRAAIEARRIAAKQAVRAAQTPAEIDRAAGPAMTGDG